MIHSHIEVLKEEKEIVDFIECDVCHKVYKYDINFSEIQEFVQIHQDCGYESVFGDNNIIKIDICQHCFKSMLITAGVDSDMIIKKSECPF